MVSIGEYVLNNTSLLSYIQLHFSIGTSSSLLTVNYLYPSFIYLFTSMLFPFWLLILRLPILHLLSKTLPLLITVSAVSNTCNEGVRNISTCLTHYGKLCKYCVMYIRYVSAKRYGDLYKLYDFRHYAIQSYIYI